ncbi:MAG TPA: hypothetical protein VGG27_03370 [Magnetospirillaceae bacterium]|jgi:hypothetical protein
MTRYWLAGAAALIVVSGTAFAQTALTAHDVTGKRLIDVNGAPIGHIISANDRSATVRTTAGKSIQVDMAKLSLGDGPHTVIEAGDSAAEQLNVQVENGQIKAPQ